MPGGEITIAGTGSAAESHRPQVQLRPGGGKLDHGRGEFSDRARPGRSGGRFGARPDGDCSRAQPYPISLGVQVADNLHAVSSPAVDAAGNVYVTFSGQRGQKVPVSLYKITLA